MFVTVTHAEFKPERLAEVREEIAALAGAMTKLEGYRGTETLRDAARDNVYLFLLRWEDKAAWQAYREGLYQREVVPKLEPLATEFRAVGQYDLVEG
ncbi:MAG TPA: antibiotic biosynthesis monooxygenase [Thermomicrobiales bacterium]|nr:antibiotic biosynthesis monooxygenase [Thermomicrobiales bacterium]